MRAGDDEPRINYEWPNKRLKTKIPRFFSCFSCLTPLRLEYSRGRKTASFLMSNTLKKYKNLDPQSFTNRASENVINVENCKYLKYFSSTILVLFTTCFYHFLFWRYLNSSMTSFLSDILLPFPNSNDLNSLPHLRTRIIQLEHRMMLLHNSQYSSRETTELNPVPAEIH